MVNPIAQSPTPLSIERDCRALMMRLANPWPARRQLAEIRDFLLLILPDCQIYESYIIEVVQRIPEVVARLNVRGIDPASVHPLYETMKELIIKLPSLSTVKGLAAMMQNLRSILLTLYHFVGEIPPGKEFASLEPGVQKENEEGEQNESIIIPVVERSLADIPGQQKGSGYLRRISTEITGTSNSGVDVFHTQVLVLGEHGGLTNTLTTPVLAARALLKQSHPQAVDAHFNGLITFDEVNAYHEGSSAGVAIAALLYCSLLKKLGARNRFTLNTEITMTGGVVENGDIVPVDPDALATKAEAVFFSDIRCLIVPRTQLSLAQEVVDRLHRRYPKRQLAVIGLSSLREVFYDRRLSTEMRTGLVEDNVKKIWRKKLPIAAGLVIMILVLLVLRNTVPVADDNPISADFSGGTMLIKNARGETLEEVEIGASTIRQVIGDASKPDGSKICKFIDLDGDGRNDYVFLLGDKENADAPPSLACRDLWKKSYRWRASFNESHTFPNNPIDNSQTLSIKDFIVGKFDGKGIPEVLAIANHTFFPGEAYELNAINGKILGSYLHTGHLDAIATRDLNKDGVQDIILTGWNKAFNAVALAVLDPRLISGCSPSTDTYAPKVAVPATEMYYVLLPSTPVKQPLERNDIYNGPIGFDLKDSNATFGLNVADISVNLPDSKDILKGSLTYSFDRKMELLTVNASTEWNLAATTLLREHKIPNIPSAKYLNGEFKKKVKYWNGYHWQTTPTMNVRYQEALRALTRN